MSNECDPVPITQCPNCGGTIWRQGAWFQCPDCGCKSTEWGGFFPSHQNHGAAPEFVCAVNAAKQRMNAANREKVR